MGNLFSSRASAAPNTHESPHKGSISPHVVTSSSGRGEISLRQTLVKFLDAIDYSFPSYPEFKDLEPAVRNEILSYGIDLRPGWETVLRTACTLVSMAYIRHPFEIQFSIAILVWFGTMMEDCANKDDPVVLATFQQYYITNRSQVDPLFDHCTANLNKIWAYYNPIAANAVVSAFLDFANGCSLEIMTEGMKFNTTAAHYPDYVRLKSGVGDFHAFGLWPVAQFPDIKAYVHAVPAISRFVYIVNDILSFYKEELAGETVTYVHLLRAVHNRESALEVVHDLIDVAVGLSDEIDALLSGEAKETWERWKTGYITYHLCDSRYKLSELCLIEGKGDASKVE